MQSKRKNVDKRKIFLWCAAAGIVLCAVLLCLWHNRTALAEQRVERALSVTVSQPEPRLAQEDNTETGAWITVPGTNIDPSTKQREYPYYRIYVHNCTVFYVVIDGVMEVRRFLYSAQDIPRML